MHEYKTQAQIENETPCPRCGKANWQTSYLYCSDCRNEIQRERVERERKTQK